MHLFTAGATKPAQNLSYLVAAACTESTTKSGNKESRSKNVSDSRMWCWFFCGLAASRVLSCQRLPAIHILLIFAVISIVMTFSISGGRRCIEAHQLTVRNPHKRTAELQELGQSFFVLKRILLVS